VHVYNVLRQHTQFEPIAILDNICKTFRHLIFPGGRPNRNFQNTYIRYIGSRLRFSQDRHRSGCHSLAIPFHRAKATAGFGAGEDSRSACQSKSFSYRTRSNGYHLDHAECDGVCNLDKRNKCSSHLELLRCSSDGVPEDDLASCDA